MRKTLAALLLAITVAGGCGGPGAGGTLPGSADGTPAAGALIGGVANTYAGQDGIFLDHGFMVDAMTDAQIRSVVSWLAKREFTYQLQNVGTLNAEGAMNPANYTQLAHWIAVSHAADPHQKIVAYVSGSLTIVNTPSAWAHVAAVCKLFFQKYGVDGINLDFEPYRPGEKNYVGMFGAIRKAVGPHAQLSLDYTTDLPYSWSGSSYAKISSYFNVMMPMVYDTSCKTTACYRTLIDRDLTYQYRNLAPGTGLYPLVPAYARSAIHDPSVENICTATHEIQSLVTANRLQIQSIGVWWYYGWTPASQKDWQTCRQNVTQRA